MQQPDSSEVLDLERLIRYCLPPNPSPEALVDACDTVLGAVWDQIKPLMGDGGARVVFGRALQVAQRTKPMVGQVSMAETRLQFGALRANAINVRRDDLETTVAALTQTLTEVLGGLLGPGLLLSLLSTIEGNLDCPAETHSPKVS